MSRAIYDEVERMTTVVADGRVVVQLGLLATCYLEDGHSRQAREAVAACFDLYRSWVGSQLRWAKHPKTYRFHPIEDAAAPSPRDWFGQLGEGEEWEFEYRGGDDPDAANSFSVKAFAPPRDWGDLGYVRMTFPITWFANHPGSFSDCSLEFCRTLRPLHGYGGIGVLESPNRVIKQEYEPAVFTIAQRFPGLEVDHPVGHTAYLQDGIKGVNWLTILGERWLAPLGGPRRLREQLGAEFVVRDYPGGLLIQAGPRPQLGDREKGLDPDPYVRLARVLKPVQIKVHRAFHHAGPGERFDRENSERWLFRFD